MVGSATMHNQIASQYAPGDNLPCADVSLLAPLKKSPEYRAIRPRVASPKAVDSWQDQGVHFFVFQLNPAQGAGAVPDDPPVVVFAMQPEDPAPVSAVAVTPRPGGEEAEVVDLREPESAYTAEYTGASAAAQAPEPVHENRGDANERASDNPSIDTEQFVSADPADTQIERMTIVDADQIGIQAAEPDIAEAELARPAAEPEPSIDIETVNANTADIDLALLAAVKALQEFQTIHSRLAKPMPIDSWQEDNAHFFVFELLAADGSSSNGHEPPVAVFAMQSPGAVPISAVIVTARADAQAPEIVDLR